MSDFLDQMEATKPKRGRRLTSDPTAGRANIQQVKSATASKETRIPESMKAGDYIRQTITVLPGQRELIKQLAKENNVSLLSFYRWLLDRGLMAYEAGERPEPAHPVYQDVKMGHWSSREE